jgi:hypothetical protein
MFLRVEDILLLSSSSELPIEERNVYHNGRRRKLESILNKVA